MTSRDFAYWLQGYFEITRERGGMTSEQVDLIRKHLAMVFIHEIDPKAGPPGHQQKLDEAHTGAHADPHPTIGGVGPSGAIYRC